MEASTSSSCPDSGEPQQHHCPVCSSIFPRLDYLTHHMGIHINEQSRHQFTCNTCGQNFDNSGRLNEHELSHRESRDKPFQCQYCEKKFTLKSSLKCHEGNCSENNVTNSVPSAEKSSANAGPTPDSVREDNDVESEDSESDKLSPVRRRTRRRRVVLESDSDRDERERTAPVFYCEECDKSYKKMATLMKHKKSHGKPKKHVCRLCEEEFDKPMQLKRHLKTHTSTLLSHYEQGARDLQNSLGVDADEATDKNLDPESDDDDDDESSKDELVEAKRSSKKRPSRRAAMRDPKKAESGKPKPKRRKGKTRDISPCGICAREFSRQTDKKIHMRYHTGEKPFECGMCDKRFHTKGNMLAHLQIHKPERAFQCEKCDKKFISKANLQRHTLTHTGEKPYQCDICERSFRHWTTLKLHKDRTHFKLKPFVCEHCAKAFVSVDALKVHVRYHTGERPYKCDMCDKAFAQHAGLQAHRRIHTGERPYVCTVCSRSFYQSSALKDHNLTHTGEKPLKCDVCHKGFALKCALKRHLRVHTGERPYKCQVCMKSFSASGELKLHMRKHTGEKPYQCDVCGQAFAGRSNFKKHLRDHHPDYELSNDTYTSAPPRKSRKDKPKAPKPRQSIHYAQQEPSHHVLQPLSSIVTLTEKRVPTQYHDTPSNTAPVQYETDRVPLVQYHDARYVDGRSTVEHLTPPPQYHTPPPPPGHLTVVVGGHPEQHLANPPHQSAGHMGQQVLPSTAFSSWTYPTQQAVLTDILAADNYSQQRDAELLLMMKNMNRDQASREPVTYTDTTNL